MTYGREALRRFREQQLKPQDGPAHGPDLLSQIPADAPWDDATLTVWNGERWIAWDKWLASAPIHVDDRLEEPDAPNGGTGRESSPKARAVQEGLW